MFYTYLFRWPDLNKAYYGARWAKNAKPDDLGVTYFSSSKEVKEFIKQNGLPPVMQVRKLFNSYEEVIRWEYRVLSRLKANTSEKWLNKSNGSPTPGFYCNAGMVTAKDERGESLVVTKEEFSLGNHSGIRKGATPFNKGVPTNSKTKQKISDSVKAHFSSEAGTVTRKNLSSLAKGTVVCINLKTGFREKVKKEVFADSPHLVGVNFGTAQSEEHRRKNSEANRGRTFSEETKSKISAATKGKKKGMVACFDTIIQECVSIPSEEFHTNKNRYVGVKRAKNLGYI